MARINLVTNPSAITNTTGWSAAGGSGTTFSRITTDGFYGNHCYQITKAAVVNSGIGTSLALSATEGVPYAYSAYVKVPAGQESGNIVISYYFLDSGGSTLANGDSNPSIITSDSGWTRVSVVATAPAGTVGMMVYVRQLSAGTAGQIFLADAILIEQSAYVGEYFDELTQAQENTRVNTALRKVPFPNITGMELNADISINNLILNTVDENGVVWVCTGLNGWWGQSDPEIQDVPRGLGDGSYDVNGRYAFRQIELTGVFLPPDASLVDVSRNKLVKAIDLVRSAGWLLADELPTKGALVRLSGKPDINTVNTRGRTEFSIGLKAADPIKYQWDWATPTGLTVAVANTATSYSTTVNNIGNTNVTATFKLTGPYSANTTINNTTTGTSIKVVKGIASTGASIGSVTNVYRTSINGVKYATLTLNSSYPVAVGDSITVASVTTDSNTFNGTYTVTKVSVTSGTTVEVSYKNPTTNNVASTAVSSGTVVLATAETLTINTYTKDVLRNSNTGGDRSMIDTLVDWITLQPGNNIITVTDGGANTTGTLTVSFRSGWIG